MCFSTTIGHLSRPEYCTDPYSCVTAPSRLYSHKTLYSNKIFNASLRYNLVSLGKGGMSIPSPEPMFLASGHTMSLYNCTSGSASLVPQIVRVLCTYELMKQVGCYLISQRRKLSLTEGRDSSKGCSMSIGARIGTLVR